MSVTPHDLLACAQALSRADEAGRRAVISRAYYAAYHAAYQFHLLLPTPGSVGKAKGKHEQLIGQLSSPTVKTGHPTHLASRRIGAILRDLFAARVKADYHLGEPISEEEAELAMFKAEDIFKQCYPRGKP